MILLDHCVPRRYYRLLEAWGHQPTLLTQHLRADADDDDVLQKAAELGAALLTVDLHFADVLQYPPENYRGIIVMRYSVREEEEVTATLRQLLTDFGVAERQGRLFVVQPNRYRVRRSQSAR